MNNKKILEYCEHYYEIINFEPYENDNITSKMINLYREYIFNVELNNEGIGCVKNLDKAMKRYIDDYIFRKDMQECVLNIKVPRDQKNILKLIIEKIIDFFNNYNKYTTRVIYISRWI